MNVKKGMVDKKLGKRYVEPELIRDFREKFFAQVHDLKSLELIAGINMFQMEEGKKYVTRDTLYKRLEIEQSKMRAYDGRLKSLTETGWLELDDKIKGRYRLTSIGRLYITEHAESIVRVMSVVTYEGTLQFVMRAKVTPSELMNLPNVKKNCALKLSKKGYQTIRHDEDRLILLYRIFQDHALVEALFQGDEIEVRTTSNYVHTLKRPTGIQGFFNLEKIKALDINEEKIVMSLTILVLNQILQTILEVTMIDSGAWRFLKLMDFEVVEARVVDQPKYYLLQST
jgi:hypothetical protein